MIRFIGKVSRGSADSAAVDLYSTEDATIAPQQFRVIDVGLTWEVTGESVVGIIKDRSGMAAKGLRVGGGVIDADYRGPIGVILINHTFENYRVKIGDRIAQMLVLPIRFLGEEVPSDVGRGEGGFGSTGQ